MNLAQLRASATKNKGPLLGVAALVVVGAGLASKRKGAGADPTIITAAQADAQDGATVAGYAPSGAMGAAGYDSSSVDVYNALQPQVEQTQSMLTKLLDRLGPEAPLPTTKPATTATPKPAVTPRPTARPLPRAGVVKVTTPKPAAKPTRTVAKPAPKPTTPRKVYVVKKGDTLSGIAAKAGVKSWAAIYSSNRAAIGTNPNSLKVGTRLVLP